MFSCILFSPSLNESILGRTNPANYPDYQREHRILVTNIPRRPDSEIIRPSAMGLNEPSVDSCFDSRFEGDLEGAERFIAM